jgi:acyl-CoA thioesterase-2
MGPVHRQTADSATPSGAGQPLDAAILAALDGLLHALELEPAGDDRFRVVGEPGRFDRVFGGQVLAQALLAAGKTVAGKAPQSLHAYFVEAGAAEESVDLVVERVRDGRSISTRRVTVEQDGRPLLLLMASFHTGSEGAEFAEPTPQVPEPLELPVLQDWVHEMPAALQSHGRTWVDQPPPLDLRIGEPPNFLGGASARGARSHWMRLPRDVGDDPGLHAALLAYASDYLLLDMIPRANPDHSPTESYAGFSLDHALWFHRPVRFDRWHLHTQQTQALSGHLGLVRGTIHDDSGHLVASVMQEGLVRPR